MEILEEVILPCEVLDFPLVVLFPYFGLDGLLQFFSRIVNMDGTDN